MQNEDDGGCVTVESVLRRCRRRPGICYHRAMPIYEYLCEDCNRIYSFLVRRMDEARQPACPRCGAADLHKQVSGFAFRRGGSTSEDVSPGGEPDPMDDPRVEREMMKLMRDAEHMDESDPRQLASLMRRMSDVTGEPFDDGMEEAVRRLESGEDPEKIEEDLGEALDGPAGAMGGPHGAPSRDDGLYEL